MHSFCLRCRRNRVQAPRNTIHRWLNSVLAYANTSGCGTFNWGWDVRILQQPILQFCDTSWYCKRGYHLHSISGGQVALQAEGRAAARSAWTVSQTAGACFNHWGARGARASGLKQSCALEESPVVYSNGYRTANWTRVTGAVERD